MRVSCAHAAGVRDCPPHFTPLFFDTRAAQFGIQHCFVNRVVLQSRITVIILISIIIIHSLTPFALLGIKLYLLLKSPRYWDHPNPNYSLCYVFRLLALRHNCHTAHPISLLYLLLPPSIPSDSCLIHVIIYSFLSRSYLTISLHLLPPSWDMPIPRFKLSLVV